MAARQEQQAVCPVESRCAKRQVPFMNGLEPSDEDGDVVIHGEPQHPCDGEPMEGRGEKVPLQRTGW